MAWDRGGGSQVIGGLDAIILVDLVKRAGVEGKQAGTVWKGLCPFHTEKTPFFTIFPDNRFYCFGCQARGDGVDFVQLFYQVDFKEALKILGLSSGPATPQMQRERKRRDDAKALVKALRRWEVVASDEVGSLLRATHSVLSNIETEQDLERLGHLYHEVPVLEYHMDILTSQNNGLKVSLFKNGVKNG